MQLCDVMIILRIRDEPLRDSKQETILIYSIFNIQMLAFLILQKIMICIVVTNVELNRNTEMWN
jgi:hypothetical protein